jgi:PIN domain nuclease of toxin-antitoxin system
MRLLLDAHALIWWLGDDPRLSDAARQAIETSEEALVGAGTLVEIAIKRSLGKLDVDKDWPEQSQADGFGVLSVSWLHVMSLQRMPYVRIGKDHHRDPFDRLLAAQALTDATPVVTYDAALSAYGVSTVW